MENAKNASISARIMALVSGGMDLAAAYDAVLGAGAYARLAGELCAALRAR